MKRLISLLLLLATTFAAKAQEMGFDETVKYINDKIECCVNHGYEGKIEAKKNGDIIKYYKDGRKYGQFNFFDIENMVDSGIEWEKDLRDADKAKSRVTKFGLTLIVQHNNEIWIQANGTDFSFIPDIVDKITADRLFNALLHLRSLCTKVKDPFDK